MKKYFSNKNNIKSYKKILTTKKFEKFRKILIFAWKNHLAHENNNYMLLLPTENHKQMNDFHYKNYF